ncbi:TPA: hypothetical protein ACH1NN_004782, partial [Klebsiella pneumoniae]
FAGKKSAQIREILISESAWEEMTCLFAPSLINGSRSPAMDSVYPHGQLQTRFPQLPAFQQSKSLSFVKLDQGGGIADR